MASNEVASYGVKLVQFLDREVAIVTQAENGPCPIISIANVLLLRGRLSLPGSLLDRGSVPHHTLLDMLASILLDSNNPDQQGGGEGEGLAAAGDNTRHQLDEAIALLPTMDSGLDVNVRFRHVRDFEYTRQCSIFDLLDIGLVHGWLVDPQDVRLASVVGSKSYNELVEQVIASRSPHPPSAAAPPAAQEPSPAATQGEGSQVQRQDSQGAETQEERDLLQRALNMSLTDSQPFSAAREESREVNVNPLLRSASTEAADEDSPAGSGGMNGSSGKKSDIPAVLTEIDAHLVENFLEDSASQLTYHGVVALHAGVRERELCVMFRNNHFSTLFRLNGALYILVTDQGYQGEKNIVWECLSGVDNNCEFVTGAFKAFQHSSDSASAVKEASDSEWIGDAAKQAAQLLSQAMTPAKEVVGAAPPDAQSSGAVGSADVGLRKESGAAAALAALDEVTHQPPAPGGGGGGGGANAQVTSGSSSSASKAKLAQKGAAAAGAAAGAALPSALHPHQSAARPQSGFSRPQDAVDADYALALQLQSEYEAEERQREKQQQVQQQQEAQHRYQMRLQMQREIDLQEQAASAPVPPQEILSPEERERQHRMDDRVRQLEEEHLRLQRKKLKKKEEPSACLIA